MDNNLIEFRCTTIGCDKLLAKCEKHSFLEIKCKSCKNYSYFSGGKAICSKDLDEKIGMTKERSEETLEFLKNMFGFK